MAIINVTKENFEAEVLNARQSVLVDLWASWCGPCRMVGSVLEELARERPDVKICKINVDEQPELANRFGVVSIPLLVVMENGRIVDKAVGARPKADIEALLP